MKKFINDPFDVVDEMLEGFLDVHKSYVKKIESARTLVRCRRSGERESRRPYRRGVRAQTCFYRFHWKGDARCRGGGRNFYISSAPGGL